MSPLSTVHSNNKWASYCNGVLFCFSDSYEGLRATLYRLQNKLLSATGEVRGVPMYVSCLSVYDVQLAFCHSTWTFPPCFPAARTHSRRRGCPSLAQEEDSLPNQRIEKLPEVRYHRRSNYYVSCTHIHVLYTEWQCPWHCVNDVMWLYYNNCICSCDVTWWCGTSCDMHASCEIMRMLTFLQWSVQPMCEWPAKVCNLLLCAQLMPFLSLHSLLHTSIHLTYSVAISSSPSLPTSSQLTYM